LPAIRKHYEFNGLVPVGNAPEEFADFLRREVVRQAEIAKRIGLKPQ
jgi:tripartite-type tricarboxylate transporter receptor subunit TctC